MSKLSFGGIKMKLKNLMLTGLAALVLGTSSTNAQERILYDNFESGSLDPDKWEIRQDIEGQPFMEEYGILNEGISSVYHTKTTNGGRVALVPVHEFIAGESLEYDVNHISGEGNRGNILLVTTTNFPSGYYGRHGIVDPNSGPSVPFDFGVYHIKLKVNANSLEIIRITADGSIMAHTDTLTDPNARYKFYIESWADDDAHLDYDDFYITSDQPIRNEEKSWSQIKRLYK